MSRLGKLPVALPKGVEVKLNGAQIAVRGPKGELNLTVKPFIAVKQQEQSIVVEVAGRGRRGENPKAFQGLYRALVNNMVLGVTKGWEKRLQLVGVGYRASTAGNSLELQVGYSQPVKLQIPAGLKVEVEKPQKKGAGGVDAQAIVVVHGSDRQMVGQFAALVRAQRKPEPYKGKGIRYEGEYVRRKEGKSGKGK